MWAARFLPNQGARWVGPPPARPQGTKGCKDREKGIASEKGSGSISVVPQGGPLSLKGFSVWVWACFLAVGVSLTLAAEEFARRTRGQGRRATAGDAANVLRTHSCGVERFGGHVARGFRL